MKNSREECWGIQSLWLMPCYLQRKLSSLWQVRHVPRWADLSSTVTVAIQARPWFHDESHHYFLVDGARRASSSPKSEAHLWGLLWTQWAGFPLLQCSTDTVLQLWSHTWPPRAWRFHHLKGWKGPVLESSQLMALTPQSSSPSYSCPRILPLSALLPPTAPPHMLPGDF